MRNLHGPRNQLDMAIRVKYAVAGIPTRVASRTHPGLNPSRALSDKQGLIRVNWRPLTRNQSTLDCEARHHEVPPFISNYNRVYSWREPNEPIFAPISIEAP